MEINEVRRIAKRALKDLHPWCNTGGTGEWETQDLPQDEFPLSELVYYTLTKILKFDHSGYFEKVRWVVSATFRNVPFTLVWAKFGPKIQFPQITPQEDRLALLKCLRRAAGLAEDYLKGVAERQMRIGNITIANRFSYFDNAYGFFREKAEEAYKRPKPKPAALKKDKLGNAISETWDIFKNKREGGYFASSMLDAYFSCLEHLLVLVLPFTDFDPTNGRLVKFVNEPWGTKWRTVFDFKQDREAQRIYETLRGIKETFRNPNSHGGFTKDGTSFYFHVPGMGACPVLLSKVEKSYEFEITNVPEKPFQEICAQLDVCDAFLEKSKLSAAVFYATKGGLDLNFSKAKRKQYKQASRTRERLEKFMTRESDLWMLHANMDY